MRLLFCSLRRLTFTTYSFANLFSLFGQGLGVGDVVVRDGSEQFLLVFAVERRLADQHFVEQDAVSPPIDAAPVRLVQDDLHKRVPRRHTVSNVHISVSSDPATGD